MSRRLINRAGGSVASSSSASTALPDYQPPSCPLNDAARRALNDLSTNRGTVLYQMHLKDSVRFIGSSVGDLHERLREQRDNFDRLRAKREERGTEKTPDEMRLENHIEDLEARVHSLTDMSEEAIRDLIDRKAELEDETAILSDLYTHVAPEATRPSQANRETRQSRRRSDRDRDLDSAPPESDEEAEDKATVAAPSVLESFNNQRDQKKAEYNNLSMHERYALNNDYAAFKKLWHDSMAGEDGPPLPDASRWFRSDGQPVMRSQADEDAGDDDDIAVAREILSINCPLTLREMTEPYSNRKCKHTFEKTAILDYLTMRGEKQCPQTGCSQMFSRARFEEDFFLDQAMVRRIRRARQAQEKENLDEDDDDDDLGEDDVVVRGQNAAPGRVLKRERA